MPRLAFALTASTLIAVASAPAMSADAVGTWRRDNGNSRVRIAPCGQALCGTVAWLRDPNGPGKVGQRVFIDMKPSGPNEWRGQAFNPEDGRTYSGKMTLSGDSLTTAGCIVGGLICRSVEWSRVN